MWAVAAMMRSLPAGTTAMRCQTPPKRPIRRGQVGQERGGSAAEAASCSGSAAEAASCSGSDDTGNIFACWGETAVPPSAALGAPGPRVARLPLQYLHEQPSQLIHRDLKPDNVLPFEGDGCCAPRG